MQSDQKFPNFNFLSDEKLGLNIKIDLVLISHFHNDHCGALPYFTEQYGYDGPIIMTHPTKAIIPLMLEDARRIEEREGKKSTKTTDKAGFSQMPGQQTTSQQMPVVNMSGQPIHMESGDGRSPYAYRYLEPTNIVSK